MFSGLRPLSGFLIPEVIREDLWMIEDYPIGKFVFDKYFGILSIIASFWNAVRDRQVDS